MVCLVCGATWRASLTQPMRAGLTLVLGVQYPEFLVRGPETEVVASDCWCGD